MPSYQLPSQLQGMPSALRQLYSGHLCTSQQRTEGAHLGNQSTVLLLDQFDLDGYWQLGDYRGRPLLAGKLEIVEVLYL